MRGAQGCAASRPISYRRRDVDAAWVLAGQWGFVTASTVCCDGRCCAIWLWKCDVRDCLDPDVTRFRVPKHQRAAANGADMKDPTAWSAWGDDCDKAPGIRPVVHIFKVLERVHESLQVVASRALCVLFDRSWAHHVPDVLRAVITISRRRQLPARTSP